MKFRLLSFLLLCCLSASAQYYYKDVIGATESSGLIKAYQKAGITAVRVNSYDADNMRNEDFSVTQTFSKPHALLRTTTRNAGAQESILLSYADANGRVVKTIDSTANVTSTTEYGYTEHSELDFVKSTSTDTAKRLHETEVHQWQWAAGQVARMLRIVNGTDTTVVTFKVDGGKVVEEWSTRRGVKSEPVYYYYNAQNRLTDIVRYNNKAKRLLPEYMFEYSPEGQVIQKITVPSNSSDYLIWRYQYNAEGLKIKEAVYDRYKTLNGTIEYQYERGE